VGRKNHTVIYLALAAGVVALIWYFKNQQTVTATTKAKQGVPAPKVPKAGRGNTG
jgi:hypothetical protein